MWRSISSAGIFVPRPERKRSRRLPPRGYFRGFEALTFRLRTDEICSSSDFRDSFNVLGDLGSQRVFEHEFGGKRLLAQDFDVPKPGLPDGAEVIVLDERAGDAADVGRDGFPDRPGERFRKPGPRPSSGRRVGAPGKPPGRRAACPGRG